MICKYILLITVLKEPELIFCTQLNGFKQVLLLNTNNSIEHYSFILVVPSIAMKQCTFSPDDPKTSMELKLLGGNKNG